MEKKTEVLHDKRTGDDYIFIPPAPTETERGGITSKTKTTESLEAAVDPNTGRMYVPDNHTKVDETLTKAGEAADAKVVGDKIKNSLNGIQFSVNNGILRASWEE